MSKKLKNHINILAGSWFQLSIMCHVFQFHVANIVEKPTLNVSLWILILIYCIWQKLYAIFNQIKISAKNKNKIYKNKTVSLTITFEANLSSFFSWGIFHSVKYKTVGVDKLALHYRLFVFFSADINSLSFFSLLRKQ